MNQRMKSVAISIKISMTMLEKNTYMPATNRDSISIPFLLTSGSKIYFSSAPVTPRSLTCSAKNLTNPPYALFLYLIFLQGLQLAADSMAIQHTFGSQGIESSCLWKQR